MMKCSGVIGHYGYIDCNGYQIINNQDYETQIALRIIKGIHEINNLKYIKPKPPIKIVKTIKN